MNAPKPVTLVCCSKGARYDRYTVQRSAFRLLNNKPVLVRTHSVETLDGINLTPREVERFRAEPEAFVIEPPAPDEFEPQTA